MSDSPASRLKEARLHIRATQAELGDALGVSKQSVSGYENGSVVPSYTDLMRVFRPHGVSANWILTGEGSMLERQRVTLAQEAPPAHPAPSVTGPVLYYVVDDSGRRFGVIRPFPQFELIGEAPEISARDLAGIALAPNIMQPA